MVGDDERNSGLAKPLVHGLAEPGWVTKLEAVAETLRKRFESLRQPLVVAGERLW